MLTLQLPRARYPATAHADVARQPGACPPAVCQQHVLWTQPRRRLGPVSCRTLAHPPSTHVETDLDLPRYLEDDEKCIDGES